MYILINLRKVFHDINVASWTALFVQLIKTGCRAIKLGRPNKENEKEALKVSK